MAIDPDALTKKDKDELIEMIEKQDARITELQTKVKRGQTEGSVSTTDTSSINAFDYASLETIGSAFESVKNSFTNMTNIFDTEVFKQLDEYATQMQTNFGLSKARISEFKTSIADTVPELVKMGYDEAGAVDVLMDAMDGLKTAASLNSQTLIQLGATAKVTGQDVDELAEGFRGVGMSMQVVGKEMESVVDYARSVGVSVKSVSAGVVDNIGKLNLYNFDNGVQGLAKMAATSERMGVSMSDTFRIAEDLFSPEKAINYAASLQRLGVTSSALLDPLRAMDLAQNNPEELQKEIVNLSKEFTTFNEQTGKMEILPGAKRRLREIAGELGIDAGEFAKMSIQAADFDRKLKQIKMPSLAEGDEETKELIASMAQLDAGGVATIQVKDAETGTIKEKKVEELTPDDINNLKKANEESSKSIEEIAINQLDETKQITAILQSGELAGKFGRATAPTMDKLGTVVAGTYKDMANRYREQLGTTQEIRNKFEGVARPAENFLVGQFTDNKEMYEQATLDFIAGSRQVVDSFLTGAQTFMSDVLDGAVKRIQENYSPDRGNETKTVNVNWTINGDPNVTKNINQETFNKMLETSTLDPNTKVTVSSNMNGVTAPSATTGGKNK